MNNLTIVIANDKSVLKMEKEIINFIYGSVKEEIPQNYTNSNDYLGYSVDFNIITSEKTGESKKISLYTELHKGECSTDMEGIISGQSKYINGFTDVRGTIHITATKVTGKISMKYNGRYYSGDIKGESVCKGFTPIFTCISDLYSDDQNSPPLHLNCNFASKITQLCSDRIFYDELSHIYNRGIIPYDKYISGWKKIGHSYRYISPETHTSIVTPKNVKLSSEKVMYALQYINSDLGMLVFFHSIRSLIFRFFKPKNHADLNINCDSMFKEEAIKYISSIVDFFGSPNITRGIKSEKFALNHKFKITDVMPNIDGLNKDTRLFKDFPVFLFGERRKTDIYHPDTTPQPAKTKIRQSLLKSMLSSDISYIFLNAENDDKNIMNFNYYQGINHFDNSAKFIFKHLIQEYICYLENIINCTLVISHKNKKLINLHKEIFFEARYEAFDEFLVNLRAEINYVADSNLEDYIILCQHISYTDVIKLYEYVKYSIDCCDDDTFNLFNVSNFNKIFGEFIQDIINRSQINSRDMKYLERIELFTYYFDDLDNNEAEINRMLKESIPKKDKKELKRHLKNKKSRFANST